MKKIIGIVGGVVAVGLLSYPGFGVLAEKGLRHQLDAMPKQYGMSLELTSFSHHWFTSDAKLHWMWQMPAHLTQNDQGQTVTVSPQHFEKEFNIKIFHGPIVFHLGKPFFGIGYANSTLDWPIFTNMPNKDQFSKGSVFPKINLQMGLNFLFQTSWNTEVPPFNLISLDKKTQLKWQGLSLTNKLGDKAKFFDGVINFVGLNLIKDKSQFTLTDVQSDYKFKQDPSNLYTGRGNLNVAAVDILDFNQNKIKLADFALNTASDVNNNQFSASVKMQLKKLLFNDKSMGPFELDTQLSNLNPGVLYRMHQTLQQEQNASPSFRQKNLWSLMSSLPELVKYGFEYDLKKLHVVLENGRIDSSGSVVVPSDASGKTDSLKALQKLDVNWNIQISQGLLSGWVAEVVEKQMSQQMPIDQNPSSVEDLHKTAVIRTDAKIASLLSSGVLESKASDYIISIHYKNGQLTVNNKSFDPAWLVI